MVEVTQEDRDAALAGYLSFFETEPSDAWLRAMMAGKHDDDCVAQAFAAHREAAFEAGRLAERKAVVEWLRSWHSTLAYAIEDREHLENHDD